MREMRARSLRQKKPALGAMPPWWPQAAIALLWLSFTGIVVSHAETESQPTYVLRGSLSYADFQSYRLLPFEVPPGTKRMTLALAYTGRDQRTVVDLGLFDPERFRGWSGGNKTSITVSEVDATPSYLPGSLPAGTWKVLLGIPNIRPGVKADYEVRVFLSSTVDPSPSVGLPPPILGRQAGWYQGDLHAHTGHSDGSCMSLAGRRVPCPEFKLLEAAAERGLDFLAVTDHNTTSTYNALLQWQPYFDTLLLLRGRELTTFHGHTNMYGTSAFIDFRLGHGGQTVNRLLDEVHRAGAIISINHPGRPSGEECMGCGWTAKPETDFSQVDAIEVVNGPDAETRVSGIPFWEEQLNQGHRITAIGGSDDHQAGALQPGGRTLGLPTTVVYARKLSEAGILEGIKAGHAYLKLNGPEGPVALLHAQHGTRSAMMGDNLRVHAGERISFNVQVVGGQGNMVEIIHNGKAERLVADPAVGSDDETKRFELLADGGRHWYRVNLRAQDGTLLVLTNPIYFNFPQPGED